MILDKVDITAYKYQFSNNLLLEERNFFNYTNPSVLVSSLNIKSYLLDLGQLQFSFDDTTENSYHLIPSEINFTVASVTAITDFFGLYDSDIYNRFKIEIKYNGLVIWLGIINPDSFKQTYKPSPDSYRLSFTSFGLEKEFSDYFKAKFLTLLETSDPDTDPDEFLGIYFMRFADVLKEQFGTSIIYELESNISDFRVALDDVISNSYQSKYYPITFIKAGFNNIVDLKETKWEWFKKTLSAMGWVFYFRGDTMVIKNRRSLLSSNYNILSSVLLEWEYNKQFAETGYNHIFVPDSVDIATGSGLAYINSGLLAGIDSMYGQRGYLFSDLTQNYLETTPFRDYAPSGILSNYDWIWENNQNITLYTDDDGNLIIKNALTTSAGTSFAYTGSINYLNADRILKLDTGKSGGRIETVLGNQVLQGNNIYDPSGKTFDLYQITDINYANALYRYNDTTDKYETYQDYMRTSQALYNFTSMLQSKSIKRVKAKVKSLLLNNKEDNFYFDSTEIPNAVKFSLNSISYDLINEITTLELEQNV